MYVLGLLSNVGHLALASVHPERYSKLLSKHDPEAAAEFTRYERREFELDHAEVAETSKTTTGTIIACLIDLLKAAQG